MKINSIMYAVFAIVVSVNKYPKRGSCYYSGVHIDPHEITICTNSRTLAHVIWSYKRYFISYFLL